jgi:predicted dithiol-disulfide oxidoreductase (DUF899 family)
MMQESALNPAFELAHFRKPMFPGESTAYSAAREALLAKEIEVRRQLTRVAEQRQALPPGPVVAKNYRFKDEAGADLSLADLFGNHNTLITYFWMYGPQRKRPCPMCTSWLGSVDGNATDVKQRAAFFILGRSPVERQQAFAKERGWQNLDFAQTIGDDYARDLGALTPEGDEYPALVIYQKDGDAIRASYAAEMPLEAADPGQDPRTAPDIASLWNLLDLTPEGRGENWYPKLSY